MHYIYFGSHLSSFKYKKNVSLYIKLQTVYMACLWPFILHHLFKSVFMTKVNETQTNRIIVITLNKIKLDINKLLKQGHRVDLKPT